MTVKMMKPFLLVLQVSLLLIPTMNGQSVENLPPYNRVVNLTETYQSILHEQTSQDRLFPSVRFTHNGSIIGWRFPAAPGRGMLLPSISIFRLREGTTSVYDREGQVTVSTCTVSVYNLDNGTRVELHESGPRNPIPFQEGDVLGLHLRNNNAHFVPFLYNSTSSLAEDGEHMSYFLRRQISRDMVINTNDNEIREDTFQPLFGLATCADSVNDTGPGIELCDGTTLFNNVTCIELATNPPATTSTTASVTTSSPSTPVPVPPATDSNVVLVVAITVPVLGVLLILVISMAVVMCLCVYSIRRSKKRRHSMYADEVAMDDLNGMVPTAVELTGEDHTYDIIVQKTDTIREIQNDMYTKHATTSYREGNGAVAVANYEEPLLSLSQASQDSSRHLYDKPRDIYPPGTPPPPAFTPTSSPLSHPSHLTPSHSPQLRRAQSPGYYHSLERPHEDKPGMSTLLVSSIPGARSESSSPIPSLSDSPNMPRAGTLPMDHSVSPKARHRLTSAPNQKITPYLTVEREELLRPQSEQGYATLRAPHDFTFKLETGVYVPTKKQINDFTPNPRDSIFDDTVYDCLSQGVDSPYGNNWSFFTESEIYWRPASNTATLYQQLASRKYREIIRKQIQIVSHLGSGEFGTVCKGLWHTEQGELEVAVKMLSSKSNEEATVRFLQEAAIMGQFRHPNIVRLHGVITVGEPVMIVLELVNNGDLRKYLKSLRPSHSHPVSSALPQQLLDFSSEIALGMEYLARKEFLHRDLAARNILLTEDYNCKIADFGLSRDLEDEEFYISNGGKVPIKWTAPEALHYRRYSPASDVWSFGTLLYEIWSLGQTPYKNKTPEETVELIDSGYRMPPPPGCPRAVYKLMIDCWHPDPQCRPTFTDLVKSLAQEESLLSWSQDDLQAHPQVSTLGADLAIGELMYTDLQNVYVS